MKGEDYQRRWARFILTISAVWAGATVATANPNPSPSTNSAPPVTPRDFYNAGTKKLAEAKLREAEALLESALSSQQERVQPGALYNLGHVRFGQGVAELKKGPTSGKAAEGTEKAEDGADGAIHQADEALAGDDLLKLLAAYQRGRGARKDLKEATEAVRLAMEKHKAALLKWQRASSDFKGAVELVRSDADAARNAETVDRCIAKLVDSMKKMQQCAGSCASKGQQLGQKMKQLKGRIPASQMPPGAAGDDDEEEDQPLGKDPNQKEAPSKEGQEMALSPEQASWLLQGFKLDTDRRLPMGQAEQAKPKDRNRPSW